MKIVLGGATSDFSSTREGDTQIIKGDDRHYINKFDYSDIEFPVSIKQYNNIEKQKIINVNVFGYEEKQFFPIYVSKEYFTNVLNLLLITKSEKKHHVLIKDFNSLMYNKTEHKARKYFCMFTIFQNCRHTQQT